MHMVQCREWDSFLQHIFAKFVIVAISIGQFVNRPQYQSIRWIQLLCQMIE